ncbi:MAG: choice-of-anchor L domain-containing protein [Myxococcales bacterium]|nr:choice-of-anchor L domain-containing protein [Myxococcales bacterium]
MRDPAVIVIGLAMLGSACGDDTTPMSSASGTTTDTPVSTGEATVDGSTSTGSSTASTGDGTGSGDSEGSGSDEGSSTGEELCEAPARVVPCDAPEDAPSPMQAIGLDCPGGPEQAITLSSATFASSDPDAWRVARRLGTYVDPASDEPAWGPTHGEQLLMITTGWVAPVDELGAVVMDALDQDANDNPDGKPLPAPMTEVPGSAGTPFMGCDGVGDCSDSLWNQWLSGGSAAMDLLWFQLRTEVPGGTHGYRIDFAFFSEEFPESVGTTFNDMFVVWSSSETYVGNLCFVDEQPCTVTSLWPVQYPEVAPQLEGTGFLAHDFDEGGGTGWFQIKGSAAPHESLELTFALFDMGDEELDTLVLLDGFSWDCQGCTPTPDNPCGVVER